MYLGPRVLLEIMNIVQEGLLKEEDISSKLRNIEVEIDVENSERVELKSYVQLKKGGY